MRQLPLSFCLLFLAIATCSATRQPDPPHWNVLLNNELSHQNGRPSPKPIQRTAPLSREEVLEAAASFDSRYAAVKVLDPSPPMPKLFAFPTVHAKALETYPRDDRESMIELDFSFVDDYQGLRRVTHMYRDPSSRTRIAEIYSNCKEGYSTLSWPNDQTEDACSAFWDEGEDERQCVEHSVNDLLRRPDERFNEVWASGELDGEEVIVIGPQPEHGDGELHLVTADKGRPIVTIWINPDLSVYVYTDYIEWSEDATDVDVERLHHPHECDRPLNPWGHFGCFASERCTNAATHFVNGEPVGAVGLSRRGYDEDIPEGEVEIVSWETDYFGSISSWIGAVTDEYWAYYWRLEQDHYVFCDKIHYDPEYFEPLNFYPKTLRFVGMERCFGKSRCPKYEDNTHELLQKYYHVRPFVLRAKDGSESWSSVPSTAGFDDAFFTIPESCPME